MSFYEDDAAPASPAPASPAPASPDHSQDSIHGLPERCDCEYCSWEYWEETVTSDDSDGEEPPRKRLRRIPEGDQFYTHIVVLESPASPDQVVESPPLSPGSLLDSPPFSPDYLRDSPLSPVDH